MIRSMMQEERRASHVMMSPPFMLYMISAFRFESASLASGNLRVMTGLSVSVWLRELLASQCTLKTVLMEERERGMVQRQRKQRREGEACESAATE